MWKFDENWTAGLEVKNLILFNTFINCDVYILRNLLTTPKICEDGQITVRMSLTYFVTKMSDFRAKKYFDGSRVT